MFSECQEHAWHGGGDGLGSWTTPCPPVSMQQLQFSSMMNPSGPRIPCVNIKDVRVLHVARNDRE